MFKVIPLWPDDFLGSYLYRLWANLHKKVYSQDKYPFKVNNKDGTSVYLSLLNLYLTNVCQLAARLWLAMISPASVQQALDL